jgi:hypothetical protein
MPFQVFIQDFLRSPVPESRVETSPVIAELDPPRNLIPGLFPGRVNGPVGKLIVRRPVEALGQRVVIALTVFFP